MAERKAAPKGKKESTRRETGKGFTAEEKAAMKERARELKSTGDGTSEVLAKIAEMPQPDRALAERVHEIVTSTGPELTPRTWYGMPAYAKDGKVVCFFKNASKFKSRYATLGFSDKAHLDDGPMWPAVYALPEMTPDVEARIAALLKKAVG